MHCFDVWNKLVTQDKIFDLKCWLESNLQQVNMFPICILKPQLIVVSRHPCSYIWWTLVFYPYKLYFTFHHYQEALQRLPRFMVLPSFTLIQYKVVIISICAFKSWIGCLHLWISTIVYYKQKQHCSWFLYTIWGIWHFIIFMFSNLFWTKRNIQHAGKMWRKNLMKITFKSSTLSCSYHMTVITTWESYRLVDGGDFTCLSRERVDPSFHCGMIGETHSFR